MLSYSLCILFSVMSYALIVNSVCGHWVVDLLDYLIMKYPYYSYPYFFPASSTLPVNFLYIFSSHIMGFYFNTWCFQAPIKCLYYIHNYTAG